MSAAPAWAQTQPDVVIQEFTGSNIPGINFVWAAVLIGIAVIVLVAQQITHRLALRREADARAELSRQLIEARERLATSPFALIEWTGAGAIELESRAAELLSLNRPQTTLAELRGLLRSDGPHAEEAWTALTSGKGATQTIMRHVHTNRWLRLQRLDQGGPRRLWIDDVTETMGQVEESKAAVRGFMELLDRLPMPIWCRDETLAITYGNQAFHRLLDLPPGEAPRAGRDINSAARALAARAQKLGMVQSESQQQVVGGTRRLFDFNEAPLPTGALIGYALDQTALEETHAELARHIAAHDDVLQSLGTGIVIFGPDKRVKFFNAAYRDLFELDAQFLQSEPTIDEVLDALRERRQITEQADFRNYKQEFARHIMSIISPFEELMHTPRGRTFRMVATPHPMGGVTLTYEDVTDRLALEASYNTLTEVQRETIDHLYEGIAVYGSDGRLKLHNPAFTRMWSLTEDELENQPHVSKVVDMVAGFFTGRKDWPALRERIVSEVAERELRNVRIERSDRKVIDVAAIPLPDGGRLYKYTDVTDSINMERALRERNEALMAADRLKSEFIANVSYEFRTPLNAIIGYAELLSRQYFGALNEKQQEYSHGILDAAQALLLLISDVIDVAAIEAGYIKLDLKPIDVQDMLEASERLFQQRARMRSVTLSLDTSDDLGEIMGDQQRLKQALSNLLSNALSAAPYGGTVTLRAKRQPLQLALAVEVSSGTADGGAIESSALPAEIGGSAGSGRDVTSGLGIALVRTLVELHGGRVETEIGLGYRRVVCTLPLDPSGRAAAAS
ncbi:sensor histidine kinase [Dongia deserti]|uniref:sensor histidine kinase n=1 Tax=Dongia deserti TaxID=2268030 RepID=UPI0013C53535|nr:PAS domain-containing sensor histidine kinase [Dongia deserti]